MRRFLCVLAASVAGLAFGAAPAWAAATDNLADAPDQTGINSWGDFGTVAGATTETNEPAHEPGGPHRSLWLRWTAPASPAARYRISTCKVTTQFDSVLAVYTVLNPNNPSYTGITQVAQNDNGCAQGDGSRLSFAPVAGTTYFIVIDGASASAGQSNGNYDLQFSPAPANDDFAAATSLGTALPTSVPGTNDGATKEAGEPDHEGEPGGVSVWYTWTSPASPVALTISTCGSAMSATALGVYTGSSVAALAPVTGTYGTDCGQQGILRFTTTASTLYRIAVDGPANVVDRGGVEGSFDLKLGVRPANDDLANATSLSALPDSATGNTVAATSQANEGLHGGGAGGGHSVWYRWTAPHTGPVTVDTCGGTGDTLLDVYADGNSFPLAAPIMSADDGCGTQFGPSKLTFSATSGTAYLIAVDSTDGGENYQLSIADKTAPTVTIDSGPNNITINNPTPSFAFHANEPATFECSITPTGSNFGACSSPFTPLSPLPDGTYTFKVKATDASSNTGPVVQRTFTVDTTGPATTFHKTPPKKIAIPRKQVKVRFGFKSEKGATFECAMDKAAFAPCTTPVAYKVSWGVHRFKVRATDSLGNVGPVAKYRFRVVHQK
jgi:Big-like domain-containing protein